MSDPVEGLRKVLAFERQKDFSDNAVIGGLDRYLLRFVRENAVPDSHPLAKLLEELPYGGYRALHPVTRARLVERLLEAAEDGLPPSPNQPPAAEAPGHPAPGESGGRPRPSGRPAPPVERRVVGTLDSPVSVLRSVGRAREARLARLSISTVRDLLFHIPVRYEVLQGVRPIAELVPGETQTIIGEVFASGASTLGGRTRARTRVGEAFVSDRSGSIRVLWWGAPWMAKQMREGGRVALTGKVTVFRGRLQMENPRKESPDDPALRGTRVLPIYRSTEKLKQEDLQETVSEAVRGFADAVADTLPEGVRRRLGLMRAAEALRAVHLPPSEAAAEGGKRRLAFDELLGIELGVLRRRHDRETGAPALGLALPTAVHDGFIASLPFELTSAQELAISEVLADVGRRVPMNRLLEGDVGSGKTVVAVAALLAAVVDGHQGAIMAPTEILAEQHFRTLGALLDPSFGNEDTGGAWFRESGSGFVVLRPSFMEQPVRVALLMGGLKAADKGATKEAIARGEVDVAIGTHALIQDEVQFDSLALIVVDEQHRFGVEQRAALRQKGGAPHVLVMTATPIPRTLALTVYGDLDITVMREMPPGRPEVKTWRAGPRRAAEAYEFLRRRVNEGRQAFVICPLVEESESIASKAAVQEHQRLSRDIFPDLRVGLLHGRMSGVDKEATMRSFRDGELDVLVSTAVVEVGVDVPNATVMLVEGADRFGLSQLHQFRGRVRRSGEQAYCFLLSDSAGEEAEDRLRVMETTSDGFKLAEEDLKLRGPGEYFGTRQSGMPDLKLAELTDVELIELARAEARSLLEEDPELELPEHLAIKATSEALWGRLSGEIS